MKKLLVAIGCAFAASMGYAGQLNQIGAVKASKLAITPRTIAAIDALTADTTGQLVVCTDCVESALCVSTGSVNAGSWVVASGTSTAAIGGLIGHCK